MKRFFPIFIFLSLTLSLSAQSVMILHSLDMVDNATALTHYYNLFGSFNMPERDDPFPYSVIRIDLEGDANAVRQAKLQLGLNLGRLQKVQSMDKGTPNQILFLVESSVKNIYLTCGDGCEEQLLYTGSLQSNRIYACKVQYEPVASPNNSSNSGVSSEQMEQMMAMMQQMQEQNKALQQQMQQMQQNQGGANTPNNANNEVSQPITFKAPEKLSIDTTFEGNLVFHIDDISFTMVQVEGGTFTMGATKEQKGADKDEKPAHQVTLSDYYIGQTEVTQGLWQAVMGTSVQQQRDKANPDWPMRGEGDNYPMYYISWEECQTFISKLNSMLSSELGGKRFALPTEAQWEYAARGGNKSQGYKYSGSNSIDDVAWYTVNCYDKGSLSPDYGTHPVGTKQANELGLYDMSGNVWEWCQDWYKSYSSSAQTNPTGPNSGSRRVNRGGSWSSSAWCCRVSSRHSFTPTNRYSNLGLRLVIFP